MPKTYFKSENETFQLKVIGDGVETKNTQKGPYTLLINPKIIHNKVSIDIGNNTSVYSNKHAENDNYVAIGLHGYNPNCYPYLDKVLLVSKKTNARHILNLFHKIDQAQLKTIYFKDENQTKVYFETYTQNGYIDCQKIFDTRTCTPHKEYCIYPFIEAEKLETYFTYTITDELGVLMRLRPNTTPNDLLMFDGFSNEYDAFKIWSTESENHLSFINTKDYKTWHVTWGKSTSVVSDESVWQCRDKLLKCIEMAIPFHPKFRTDKHYIFIER